MIIHKVMRTPGQGQDLLWIFLWKFQDTSGILLLEYSKQQAPHPEGHYYIYLRKFHVKHNCKLEFSCVESHQLQRGCYILPTVINGHRNACQSASRLEEIVQERPRDISLQLWRSFLKPLCYTGSNKLRHSHGNWTATIKTSQRVWPFYYSRNHNMPYRRYQEDWFINSNYQFYCYKGIDNKVFEYNPIYQKWHAHQEAGEFATTNQYFKLTHKYPTSLTLYMHNHNQLIYHNITQT